MAQHVSDFVFLKVEFIGKNTVAKGLGQVFLIDGLCSRFIKEWVLHLITGELDRGGCTFAL